MRLQILIGFLLLFSKGYAQKPENEYKKMIDSAIGIIYQKILKPNKSLGTESLYLIDKNNLSYNYTGMFGGVELKKTNILDPKIRGVVKKGIRAWKIIPALQGFSLKIKIIDFFVTYKSGNYNFANGGGSETVFEYSCNENKWVLVKSEYQGI